MVVKAEVCELLEHQVNCIAVTADVWTSIATDSYLTVTAHNLEKEWTMNSIVRKPYRGQSHRLGKEFSVGFWC